ncbi:MAG: DEAD/DEAH box helicase [Thermoguttaceae bacterium]|nr:DEAD/DEAH box helicase [Thermoguttaceae bacterium]
MEPKDRVCRKSTPFEVEIQSWNRRTTLPVTLSVICPQILLDDAGKRLQIETHSMKLRAKGSDTHVFSVPLACPHKALSSIKSYFFSFQDEHADQEIKAFSSKECADSGCDENEDSEKTVDSLDYFELINSPTRIRVPNDVVKVEDRLGYILQPPIETWLGRRLLETPFEPFNYQKQGVAFLYGAHHAILADEMGLGKTMQAITTMRLLFRSGECRRVLLVCPKPLVTNWKREFDIWAPEIPVQIIEGKSERRKWLWQRQNLPVRIANYELLSRDREFFDPPGGAPVTFDLVVLDESQRIKNKSNATSESARAIPRRRSWALTGTPVENSAEDLVGIFEFLAPGYLESGMKPSQLSKLVGEYILRRTKDRVLKDLPPKLIRDAHIELTPEQYETYRLAQEEGEVRLNAMGDSVTLQHAFELLLRLKQICNYDPATGESSKLERLIADMEEVAESGRKAIVFSQWVQTIQWLKPRLEQFGPLEFHGKTPNKERDSVIEQFRNDSDKHIILMSYGAGSVGLNLQFAEYVFLFDRWWNPAVEDQAINRAHRIGASRPVTVTRFVTDGTIEEKIDQILMEKRMLSEAILSDAKGLNYSMGLSQEDIFGLFNIKALRATKKKS